MTQLRRTGGLAAAAVTSMFVFGTSAAQSATETMIKLYSEPNEFFLFDQTDVEILNYKTEENLRLCVGPRSHAVPVKVDYDGNTTNVNPGNCFLFQAKQVTVSPADTLEPGWDLQGTLEIMNDRQRTNDAS